MFNFDLNRHEDASSLWSADSESCKDASPWLREKDLVFSRDERCGFKFDAVALVRGGGLHDFQGQIEDIEAFARDLRRN